MSRYIDADKLMKDGWSLKRTKYDFTSDIYEVASLDCVPTADVVSREAYDQIKWERDTAIAQLKELGYGLGEEIRHD